MKSYKLSHIRRFLMDKTKKVISNNAGDAIGSPALYSSNNCLITEGQQKPQSQLEMLPKNGIKSLRGLRLSTLLLGLGKWTSKCRTFKSKFSRHMPCFKTLGPTLLININLYRPKSFKHTPKAIIGSFLTMGSL